MRYRETFIIKHGERLILKGVDPAGKEHHESEPGAKDEIEHYRSQLVVFADAINRPSTSAVRVPIRPAVSFTTSLESECKCCSDNNGRNGHTSQGAAKYQREHKQRNQ